MAVVSRAISIAFSVMFTPSNFSAHSKTILTAFSCFHFLALCLGSKKSMQSIFL